MPQLGLWVDSARLSFNLLGRQGLFSGGEEIHGFSAYTVTLRNSQVRRISWVRGVGWPAREEWPPRNLPCRSATIFFQKR